MDIRPLTTEVSISDQLKPQDLTLIKSLGYKSVICNRPDGESQDQPLFASIRTAAELCGIEAHYLPVTQAGVNADLIQSMKKLWSNLPKPVIVYCRSGARSSVLLNAALPVGARG